MKFYILIACAFLGYYGFDGLRGDHNLKSMTLEEVEESGVGNSRFLEISNCFGLGNFVYKYDEKNPDKVTDVIFPVVSKKVFDDYFENISYDGEEIVSGVEEISTVLLVKRSASKFTADCFNNNESCLDDLLDFDDEDFFDNGFTVKGVTLVGLEDVDSETKELILSLDYKMGDKVLFLEEDAEPRGMLLSFLMLGGGLIGALAIGASYLKKKDPEVES